jgi:hypothetical protein
MTENTARPAIMPVPGLKSPTAGVNLDDPSSFWLWVGPASFHDVYDRHYSQTQV